MGKKMFRRHLSLAGLILFITQFLIAPPTLLAASNLEKLTIGWSAIAGSQAPFWITKEAGLFEKNGLDVTMIYVDGGSKATQAMMSGDVPIAQVGGNRQVRVTHTWKWKWRRRSVTWAQKEGMRRHRISGC